MARYGNEFNERAVAWLLAPDSAETSRLSQEVGVPAATLERWLADALSRSTRKRFWTAAARWDAAIDEAQHNAWCLENGVFISDLQQSVVRNTIGRVRDARYTE